MATFKPISFIAETISVGGTPSRPERNFEAERLANRQPDPETKRHSAISDDDFSYLSSFGDFPKVIGYDANHVAVRRRDKTEERLGRIRAIFAKVK